MAKSFYVRIKHSVNYIIKNLEKIIFFYKKRNTEKSSSKSDARAVHSTCRHVELADTHYKSSLL